MQEYVSDALVGNLVDNRYQVQSRLARGGMSTVYLATDQRLDRDVALKVLHPHLADDPQFLDRLGREAKAAARLSHPHVVGVLDQGEDGRLAYLVMEFIKGHTLRDVLNDKGALPPRLALALIDPVVEGLGAAHAAGMIHRDIKPENVLIADDGRIKLGDFGLARAISTSTSTGALIGTVAYLSPELVLGKQADARSDIYSVGIMLYEMITGRQPFDGDVPIQVAYQHVNSTVAAPSLEVPGLATEIDELVQWCTDRDPDKRPVDGSALLSELRHIRTNLSDAELDLQPPAAVRSPLPAVAAPPNRPPGGTGLASDAQDTAYVQPPTEMPTETYGSLQRPTETISRTSGNPTTVMSSAPRRPAYGPLSTPDEAAYDGAAGYDDPAEIAVAPSKRAQRKLDRDEEKARQRAAATPTKTLHEGNPRRRGLLWIVLLVVAALLAAVAGWFFGMGPGSPGTVPPVANKTVAQAQDLLRTAGFQSTVKDVFNDDVSPGLVVGSEPNAGAVIRKFQPVSLAVSKGPELFPLPELTGKTLDEAKATLNSAKMALGPITGTFDEKAPAGTVLAMAPRSGNPVRHGTPVGLTVSKGPQPIPVPDVRGQEQRAAVDALEAAGLKAVVAPETVNDKNVPKGAVVAQDPASGNLTRGGTVTLTISKGPKLVEVPSFIGKQAKEAKEALEQLGFKVQVDEILGGFFGTVRDQYPVDTSVPEGSLVTLTVV
ncbi:Stk1 family PASTA domain-containing Ser/Thr kinase [Arthrobacter sp. ok362]|uniref:Stk1 family PASTA domain-containing Ser/Thr kinase n=1 Tax=Arthrobacter sp. ok362 TaxID=1761745 RepID=UPI000B8963FD|nr:Stk1 family PASTA domain-containing Ser/Thr kinase [Arthrobacter sp. ok362]